MNVAPTHMPDNHDHANPHTPHKPPTRLSHATTRAAGDGRYYYIMCPYDYEGGPCIPVLPRKKKKTGGNAFFFNFYS